MNVCDCGSFQNCGLSADRILRCPVASFSMYIVSRAAGMHGRAITRQWRRAANDPRNGPVTDVRQLSYHNPASARHRPTNDVLPSCQFYILAAIHACSHDSISAARQQLLLTCVREIRLAEIFDFPF